MQTSTQTEQTNHATLVVTPENVKDIRTDVLEKRLIKLVYLVPILVVILEEMKNSNIDKLLHASLDDTEDAGGLIRGRAIEDWIILEGRKVFTEASKTMVSLNQHLFEKAAKICGNSFTNTYEYQAWKSNYQNLVTELKMMGYIPFFAKL